MTEVATQARPAADATATTESGADQNWQNGTSEQVVAADTALSDDTPLQMDPDADDVPSFEEVAEEVEQEEQPAEPTKIKLKVYDQEVEKTPEEVVALAQQMLASEEKLEQAKQVKAEAQKQRAQIDQLFDMLRTGDHDTLADIFGRIGADFDKLVLERATHLYKLDTMNEQEKAAYERDRKLAEYEKLEQQRQAEKQSQKAAAYDQATDTALRQAMKQVGIVETTLTNRRVAHELEIMVEQGYDVQENAQSIARAAFVAAQRVRQKMDQERADYINALSPEQLKQMLGTKAAELVKAAQPPKPRPRATKESINKNSSAGKRSKYISMEDWMKG